MGQSYEHLKSLHKSPAREGCLPGAKGDPPAKSSMPPKQLQPGKGMPTGLPKGQSGGVDGSKK